jgi:hypothetical protein
MKIKQIIPADGWRALYVTRDDNYIPDMVEFPLTFWALTNEGVVGYEGRPTPHPVGEDRDDFICYLGPGEDASMLRDAAMETLAAADYLRFSPSPGTGNVGVFVQNACLPLNEDYIDDLYDAYIDWCRDIQATPYGLEGFKTCLEYEGCRIQEDGMVKGIIRASELVARVT